MHLEDMLPNTGEFASALGEWVIGNLDWTCRDDGSSSDCGFDPYANPGLKSMEDDIKSPYYVIESVNRLHAYFRDIVEAFEVSPISSDLSKDDWALTFSKTRKP